MKKALLIIIGLISFLGYSQGGPKVDVIKFRGEVTTTVRNTFDVPTGETWLIWNTTTGQLEVAGSDDVWSGVNGTVPDGDYGDISISSGVWSLDNDVVAAAELADGDYGDISISSGVLSIDTGVVGSLEITNGGINTVDLADSSVSGDKLLDNAVTTGKVLDGTLLAADLAASNSVVANYYLTADGAGSGFTWVASGGGGLASTDIDTYSELNTIVADVTLTHNGLIDTFAELDAIVADKPLVNTADVQNFGAIQRFDANVSFGSGLTAYGFSNGVSGRRWAFQENTGDFRVLKQSTAQTDESSGSYTTHYVFRDDGIASSGTDVLTVASADDAPIIDASAFSGNLTTADDTLQEIADALDGLSAGSVTQEQVEDYAGAMFSGNTENLITVTYNDGDAPATVDFDVESDLSLYDNSTSDFITSDLTSLTGAVQITNVVAGTESNISGWTPDANRLDVCTDCKETFVHEVALSDYTSDLTTGTSKAYWRVPFDITITEVRASVLTAGTGSTIIVDINDSGTTIMSTNKLSIDASEKTSTTAATAAGLTDTSISDDAEVTFDIDQIGSSTAGAGLLVKVYYTKD